MAVGLPRAPPIVAHQPSLWRVFPPKRYCGTADRSVASRLVAERGGKELEKLRGFALGEEGQNLVEFALLLPVLLYILMGIIQFGLIFAVYITINNSAREAARWGSIYIYDNTKSVAQNDTARNEGIVDRMYQSRGILNMPVRGGSTSNFSTASNGTSTGLCTVSSPTNGWWYGTNATTGADVTICYAIPTTLPTVTANEPRRGYYLEVQSYYHLQVFIPLLERFLPNDPSKTPSYSWIRLPGRITVVIN